MADMLNDDETTEQPDIPSQPTSHPLYQQVEVLINQGNWHAAQAPLRELVQLYPDDVYLKQLSETANTRSALLGSAHTAVAHPTGTPTRNLRPLITGIIVFVVILCIGASAFLAWWFVLPRIASQRQEARIAQLREDAQAALSSGDYDRAVLAYNELLDLVPGDSQALDGLEQTSQLRELVSIYSEAIAQMEAHRWDEALTILRQLEEETPGYRDVSERIRYVQQQQELESRFDEAEAVFNQEDYKLAIEKFEELQSIDNSYQFDIVQQRLFISYLQEGLAEVEAAGSDTQRLQTALDLLEKALVLRPNDNQTRGEVQLLRLYLAGVDEFEGENWAEAVSDFSPVYEARPEFADGAVSQYLYEAYLAWGDELFAKEQLEQAQEKYEAANLIRGVDNTEDAEQKIALVEETLATPTPTPEATEIPPTATPAPVVSGASSAASVAPTAVPILYPYILNSMQTRTNCNGFGYIHGVILDRNFAPLTGVVVRAYNTTKGIGPLDSNPSGEGGLYQIILFADQIEGMWSVQILDEAGQRASQVWGQELNTDCSGGAQELKTDWQKITID